MLQMKCEDRKAKNVVFALLRRLKVARRVCSPGVSTLFYTNF
jgi:hypothetical protein